MVKFALVAALAALATAKIAPGVHRHLELNDLVDVVLEFNDGNKPALRAANAELSSIQNRGARIGHLRSLLVDNMDPTPTKPSC